MTETSARFDLPFIQPGQAQKELYHNEALALIEIAVQPAVQSSGTTLPPESAAAGECWIVADGAIGAWAGRTNAIACWTMGGWPFVEPTIGMVAWSIPDEVWLQWNGVAWVTGVVTARAVKINGLQVVGARRAAVLDPAGGASIDAEARNAITGILGALRGHGLIAH